MKAVNIYNVVSIASYEARRETSAFFEYRREKRFLGIRYQKEGLYNPLLGYYYDVDKLPKCYLLDSKTGELKVKASVVIKLSDGTPLVRYFDSFEEAETAAQIMLNNLHRIHWIDLDSSWI